MGGDDGLAVVTSGIMTREQWASYSPESMVGFWTRSAYVGFIEGTGQGIVLEVTASGLAGISRVSIPGKRVFGGWIDQMTDALYLLCDSGSGTAMTVEQFSAGQALVRQLVVNGVDTVFCVPGESYLEVLDALWDELTGPDGDPFHRCVLAHYAADVQPDPHAELMWDERALAAAAGASDDSAQAHHPSLRIAGFYPSLHLNLADVLRRLGDHERAREHVEAARARMGDLPDDEATAGYCETIRTALDRVERDLDAAG